MGFQTLYYEVSINKDQLLNLFLGQGDLQLNLYEQKPIILKEFSDRQILREVDGVTIHEAKIRGVSEAQYVAYIDGKVTITPAQNGEAFICEFKLQLQDYFE